MVFAARSISAATAQIAALDPCMVTWASTTMTRPRACLSGLVKTGCDTDGNSFAYTFGVAYRCRDRF